MIVNDETRERRETVCFVVALAQGSLLKAYSNLARPILVTCGFFRNDNQREILGPTL